MRESRVSQSVSQSHVSSRHVVIRNAIAQFTQPTGEALYGRSGALTDNDDRGRDERADEEAEHEYADDDAQPLDEVHVGYLDRLRRPHPEDHRYPRVSREGVGSFAAFR